LVNEAKTVTLAPLDTQLNIDEQFSDFIKKKLIQQKKEFRKGETVSVKLFPVIFGFFRQKGTSITFKVLETSPNGYVNVTKETKIEILNKPSSNLSV
jgi:hypothetical protein